MLRRADGGPPPEDDVNFSSHDLGVEGQFRCVANRDAFKEAHGGGTIGGIASMLLATARNTKGKPKLASWEGLLPQSTTPSTPPAAWKQVEADGVSQLDGEAFVAMNRFSVVEGSEDAFEARFANRESTLASFDGFKGFMLLRREGAADDGFTHSTWSLCATAPPSKSGETRRSALASQSPPLAAAGRRPTSSSARPSPPFTRASSCSRAPRASSLILRDKLYKRVMRRHTQDSHEYGTQRSGAHSERTFGGRPTGASGGAASLGKTAAVRICASFGAARSAS